jgi:hypothetical protein
MALYDYKMVQIPPTIVLKEQNGSEAAKYLETIVNENAGDGWEFYRVDSIGVRVQPGCLGVLLGHKQQTMEYYVITFRREI